MRAHTIEVIAVKQVVQLLLIKLDGLAIAKPIGPVKSLILHSFIQQPVSVQMPDQHLDAARTATDKDIGRPIRGVLVKLRGNQF